SAASRLVSASSAVGQSGTTRTEAVVPEAVERFVVQPCRPRMADCRRPRPCPPVYGARRLATVARGDVAARLVSTRARAARRHLSSRPRELLRVRTTRMHSKKLIIAPLAD